VVHTGLEKLGLEPHLLSDELISSLFDVTKRWAHRVRPENLRPAFNWRDTAGRAG
jgi:UDP-sulfoquinovose synthase